MLVDMLVDVSSVLGKSRKHSLECEKKLTPLRFDLKDLQVTSLGFITF